jgi:D-sedoheptulose 7-phosphate isomerase
MRQDIRKIIKDSRECAGLVSGRHIAALSKSAADIISCFKKGHKVIIFGNGGSAADSQHMAAELVGRFSRERDALPAIALSVNTSTLTAVSNDMGFDKAFSRQIDALGNKGDVAVAISTSGNSPNVVKAALAALKKGMRVIALTGPKKNKLSSACDILLDAPGTSTPRVQELHILFIHILCELVEKSLYSEK